MGTAHITATKTLWASLLYDYNDQVRVDDAVDFGDNLFLLTVTSPLLPEGNNGEYELYIKDDTVHFKKWCDV